MGRLSSSTGMKSPRFCWCCGRAEAEALPVAKDGAGCLTLLRRSTRTRSWSSYDSSSSSAFWASGSLASLQCRRGFTLSGSDTATATANASVVSSAEGPEGPPPEDWVKSMRMRRTSGEVKGSRQNGQVGRRRGEVLSTIAFVQPSQRTCPVWERVVRVWWAWGGKKEGEKAREREGKGDTYHKGCSEAERGENTHLHKRRRPMRGQGSTSPTAMAIRRRLADQAGTKDTQTRKVEDERDVYECRESKKETLMRRWAGGERGRKKKWGLVLLSLNMYI